MLVSHLDCHNPIVLAILTAIILVLSLDTQNQQYFLHPLHKNSRCAGVVRGESESESEKLEGCQGANMCNKGGRIQLLVLVLPAVSVDPIVLCSK